jgi:hypothetical protein
VRWWEKIDWPGACAFVLAFGVAVTLIVGMAGAAVQDSPISEQGASLLSTLGGAAIGAIATYLGLARQQQQQSHRTRSSDRPPDAGRDP